MRRLATNVGWVVWILCAVWVQGAFAQSPIVRARIEPSEVVVGTEQRLVVDVLVPTWLLSAPRLPELEIPGVIAMRSAENAVNLSESIGGQTWSGVSTGYVLYTQRAGRYTTPADPVSLEYAVEGKPTRVEIPLPVERFSAVLAPGATGPVLVAEDFTLTQDVEPAPEGLRVGDALRRTIRMRASRTRAMLLPALETTSVDGLSAYPDTPRLVDTPGERGGPPVAERVESTSWILEQPGTYELPPLTVLWWNPEAEQLEAVDVPAVSFEVAPSPVFASGAREGGGISWRLAALVTLLVAGIAAVLRRDALARTGVWVADRLHEARTSERALFGAFVRATRSGNARAILSALYGWLDRRAPADRTPTGDELARETGVAELRRQVSGLEESLYGEGEASTSGWSPADLRRAAVEARAKRARSDDPPALGPLNP